MLAPAGAAGFSHPAGEVRAGEVAVEHGGRLSGIVAVHEKAGLAVGHHLLRGTTAGGDAGLSGAHGFQVDQTEALAEAGHDEDRGAAVKLGERGLADETGEGDAPLKTEIGGTAL